MNSPDQVDLQSRLKVGVFTDLLMAAEFDVGLERLSLLTDTSIGGLLLGTVLSPVYLPMFSVWVKGK
jgi:hypothetical protein